MAGLCKITIEIEATSQTRIMDNILYLFQQHCLSTAIILIPSKSNNQKRCELRKKINSLNPRLWCRCLFAIQLRKFVI